ncbi:MAG: YdcF family protein [Pseudomonadota bacterium]
MWKHWQRSSLCLFAVSISSLWLLSLPVFTDYLHTSLKNYRIFDYRSISFPEESAILLLGAGDTRTAPEMGNIDTVGPDSLERARYAAFLYNKIEIPIVVSGGRRPGQSSPESVLINQVLIDEFDVTPRWLDTKSQNLLEQAQMSAKILQEQKITDIVVVAHEPELYLPTSELTAKGFNVFPAPLFEQTAQAFFKKKPWIKWLPHYSAFYNNCQYLQQFISRVFYWL